MRFEVKDGDSDIPGSNVLSAMWISSWISRRIDDPYWAPTAQARAKPS